MPKQLLSRLWLFWSALIIASLVRADVTPPPAGFWDYFIEYGDQQGELFDPLDLADAEQIVADKETDTGLRADISDNHIPDHDDIDDVTDNEEQQP